MATIQPTKLDVSNDGKVVLFTWVLTTADHTGADVQWCNYDSRSALFSSSAWGGATAGIEGSNDASAYIGLADPQGTAIAKTTNAVETVLENTVYIRPRLTTVGVAATVTVSILLRKN